MENIKIWLGTAAIFLIIGAVATGTFSGLIFEDTNCEWETIESPTGETFSNFQELEEEMGTQAFNDRMEEVQENPNMDVRDPTTRNVEYQWCVYEG